ncbi:unnamed protein product [Rotaria sp. Silwood1]|nr:unnamed protein product [Rotaria sp. Silwood1]
MARYYTIFFTIGIICLLICATNAADENVDNLDLSLLRKLLVKRMPCEIRDPITYECKTRGPRSSFKRHLNNEVRDIDSVRRRKKRLPCEVRDPWTGECRVPGPRSPFK